MGYLCFAYGSNMFEQRFRSRVPHAQFMSTATLSGYSLKFHKRSSDGSAKCNVVVDESDEVLGILFRVPANEKARLDAAEGLGRGYHEELVTVVSDSGERIKALAYIADPNAIDDTLSPYNWYRHHVAIGAQDHGLAESYIASILAIRAVEDPDKARAACEMAHHELAG